MTHLPTQVQLVRGFGASRIALGAAALALPGIVGQAFGIGTRNRPASRYIGGRDLVLGLGVCLAASGRERRHWLLACGLVDLLDTAATIQASRSGDITRRRAAAVELLAGLNAVAALALAVSERSQEWPEP